MGRKNYLVEGVSGSGKTSVAEELERRGHHVIHGDRALAYYGDPRTGEPLAWPQNLDEAANLIWGNDHWIWPVDKVEAIAADRTHPMTFFCGGSRNFARFLPLFDAVFLLEIGRNTLTRRLIARPEDEFGGRPAERDFVLRLHASRASIPASGIAIDATQPIARVVDAILSHCG